MNEQLLLKHIKNFKKKSEKSLDSFIEHKNERSEHMAFYQSYTKERILSMNAEEIYSYISKLWAMLIWGNKNYVVDKLIDDNGIGNFKKNLAELVWGNNLIEQRWNSFRGNIKGM
ncbi:MAG: hypothetical protein KDD04_04900, partial [Sinomicrobium sp.]|nr:hypothetical protein [Sinomicrobium sp.]